MKKNFLENNNENHFASDNHKRKNKGDSINGDQLEKIGLSRDGNEITYAVHTAYQEYTNITPHDPPMSPGLKAYLAATNALREILIPKGWEKDDTHNHATIYHSQTKTRIVVAFGDDNTGKEGVTPQTKNYKGSRTKALLQIDEQLCFSFYDSQKNGNSFWVLLMNFANGKIAYELSLASEYTKQKKISISKQRIIFPTQETNNPIYLRKEEDNFAKLQEIEIIEK